jgi:DNA-binding NtrC family response regulator
MLTTHPGTTELPPMASAVAPRPSDEPAFVARSEVMRRLLADIEAVGRSDATVLILGESGSGKELVARALHERGPRAHGPFVAVNCAAFPDTLLEDELFGHERGAFTGAIGRRVGRFQAADGGTLLLDEVGELSPMAQAKLLRVLQEGFIEPLGTSRPVRVDVRVLSATHRDLRRMVAEGRFREDLYYRLNVLDLHVPPLRERREDLRPLLDHFLRQFGPGGRVPGITDRAWRALLAHPFPGNVRELKHAVEHAVVLARGGEVDVSHLPSEIAVRADSSPLVVDDAVPLPLAEAVHRFEREHLVRALRHCGGNRTRTARLMLISRKNLWEKMRAYDIRPAEFVRLSPRERST